MKSSIIENDLPEGGEPPSYDTPGRILVHFMGKNDSPFYQYDCEVLDHDSDTSAYWISEGVGFDYWLDIHMEFTEPGHYVVEGITGQYIKCDWAWGDEDEETWEFTSMRPATDAEISSGMLCPNQPSA
jgi:hypothetical protein